MPSFVEQEPTANPNNKPVHPASTPLQTPPLTPQKAPLFTPVPQQQPNLLVVSGSQSPEDFARQVGWKALVEAVTSSANAMYPDDAKSVALTVANTLQPYMVSFQPGRSKLDRSVTPAGNNTSGMTPGSHLSKTRENIILGAMTGKKSAEVAKYTSTVSIIPRRQLQRRYCSVGEILGKCIWFPKSCTVQR